MKKRDLVVFNKDFAVKLIRGGFELKNVKPSKTDATKVVFYFENTPASKQALEELVG